MLYGSEFRRGALHWIWVLCVAAHITSCEGVLHRDGIRGIEFFPSMRKDRSDTHQNQAVVGKKIDLKEVEKWFDGLLGCVNQYRDELKSIRVTISSDYRGDSGRKLDGLGYKAQRIGLPLLKGVNSVDLASIVGITLEQYRSSLFLGTFTSEIIERESGDISDFSLNFVFPGYSKVGGEVDLVASDYINWPKNINALSVNIKMDRSGSGVDFRVRRALPLWILEYIKDMENKIRPIDKTGDDIRLMTGVFRDLHSDNLDDKDHFNLLFSGHASSALEQACAFIKSDQENDNIFDCKKLLTFFAFESVDNCISRAEEIGRKIKKFLENLNDKIREKCEKSKDSRVFLAHNDFKKQYGKDIINILTLIKGLFGKTSSSIGSATLGYEEEISKCFVKIREKMKGYGQRQSNVLKYMVYSVLHHASKLISSYTFTSSFNFDKGKFKQECSCVNIGIINTMNMIHVLSARDKILEVFSEKNVDQYMDSLKKKCGTLISIADKVDKLGMTSAKGLTISDTKEILDIKI